MFWIYSAAIFCSAVPIKSQLKSDIKYTIKSISMPLNLAMRAYRTTAQTHTLSINFDKLTLYSCKLLLSLIAL